jgi:hypothetical protein
MQYEMTDAPLLTAIHMVVVYKGNTAAAAETGNNSKAQENW